MLMTKYLLVLTVDGDKEVVGSLSRQQRLGSAGLALHYANVITQIDTLVTSFPFLLLSFHHKIDESVLSMFVLFNKVDLSWPHNLANKFLL